MLFSACLSTSACSSGSGQAQPSSSDHQQQLGVIGGAKLGPEARSFSRIDAAGGRSPEVPDPINRQSACSSREPARVDADAGTIKPSPTISAAAAAATAAATRSVQPPRLVLYRGPFMLIFRFLVRAKVFQLAGVFAGALLLTAGFSSGGVAGPEVRRIRRRWAIPQRSKA